MKRFNKIVEMLETAVDGTPIGAHGNFWRGLSRDEFVALSVFGRRLIEVGDSSASNIVKALRGQPPFGRDLTPTPPGAIFRRMPAGRPPVPDASIDFIAEWIDDGCPDDEIVADAKTAGADLAAAVADPDGRAVAFFREFDNFFMFQANPTTSQDLDVFMPAASIWPGWSSQLPLDDWTAAVGADPVRQAARRLAAGQLSIMQAHYGTPLDAAAFADALWRFGSGTLPSDPDRPLAPLHRMDGAVMWLIWLASGDAATRLQASADEWSKILRAVAGGLVGDALFRTDRPPGDRLTITRYSATEPGVKDRVLRDMAAVSEKELLPHGIALGLEAMGEVLVA